MSASTNSEQTATRSSIFSSSARHRTRREHRAVLCAMARRRRARSPYIEADALDRGRMRRRGMSQPARDHVGRTW
eukprot:4208929-Pyramimonas_sp.AAC.1